MGIDFRRPRHIRGFRFGEVLIFDPGKALVEKTASGSIAHISDGADDVPLKSCEVVLPASLDGYSSVDVVQTGKNLFNYEDVEAFNANVIITRNDGDYTMQNNNSYGVGAFRGISFHLKPASYSLSLGEALSVPIRIYKNDAWFNNGINAGDTSCTFTVTEEADYTFSCNVSTNSSLTIKKCQFEVGSTATDYEPYTAPTQYTAQLGRTIYGGQVDIVNGEGKATWKKIVADGVNVKVTGGYASGANRLPTIQVSDAGTTPTDIKADYLTTTVSVIGTEDSILLGNSRTSIVLHIGTIQGNDGTHGYSSDAELLTACNSYLADHNLTIVYKLSNANTTDFTFTPITPTPETALGTNNFWADEGDSEVTYYAYAE